MVYKVTTKNTSPVGSTATIDFVDYNLRAMNTESNNMEGMLREDHAAWFYNEADPLNPEKVTDPNGAIAAEGSEFVGKPKEGGVLIYNTTGWSDEEYDMLDMDGLRKRG